MSNEKKKKEDDVVAYDEKNSIQKSRQKSRRVFVFYIIALFCVALCVILASYVLNETQRQQLEVMGEQLNQQTDAAQGAEDRAEKMQEQIDEMNIIIDELQKKLDETNGDLDEQKDSKEALRENLKTAQGQSDALNYLWQLEKAYYTNDTETALSIIDKMNKKYGKDNLNKVTEQPLTNEAAKEYNSICKALGAD